MFKKIILKSIMAFSLLQGTALLARDNTPIETFIRHVKENTTFTTVSNIWQPDVNFDKTELVKNVEKAQPLTIDYMAVTKLLHSRPTAINLVLPGVDGGTFTLELAQYDFLGNDFEVHEMGANKTDTRVDYTPGLYYRGVVNGIPGSLACFSFFKNEVYGLFSIPNVGNYVVVPNTMVGKEYDYNQHYLLYNDMDLLIKDQAPKCATDDFASQSNLFASKTTTIVGSKVYVNCKEIRSFMVADYIMYQKKGSSTTNCTNYITSLYNNISTIYKNEGIATQLKYIQVNTAVDGYQTLPNNSHRWLTKFGYNTQSTMHGCDLAMLLTTKNAGMGGVAWLRVLCAFYNATDSLGPYAFCNINNSTSTSTTAFPTYSWDVQATTHEMGHNIGSPHTHACVWNPPSRTTAIDKCETLEGSCANPSPIYPTGGGTIMSYCHLVTGVGINLSNGFGPQPGDTIRYWLGRSNSLCGDNYNPVSGLATANRTVTANKECTDLVSGITYYYKDNNTIDHADDTLVLMIKKNGNNIGDLNATGFSVKTTTNTGYGGGSAHNITFPSGTIGVATSGNNYGIRRYWSVTPIGSGVYTNPVEVSFPFMAADTTDINGSVPGPTAPLTNFRGYSMKGSIDPNPANNFPSATAGDITVHTYTSGSLAANRWTKMPTAGNMVVATMKINTLGGGGMFYANGVANGFGSVYSAAGIDIYPNPTSNEWFVSLKDNIGTSVNFNLYTADGRACLTQDLATGTVHTINVATLPAGVYFYRIISGENVYTGNLIKN